MKRIFLFLITNFAILFVLSITMQLLGVDRMLAQETGRSSRSSFPSGWPRWRPVPR